MDSKDKQRIREAFLAAAASPAADKNLEGTDVHVATLLRHLADSPIQYKSLEDDIEAGRTTIDKFIASLRKDYPPAPQ